MQTNGTSNGLVPMLRVYNNTARYVDQGGNKRPGAFAIYLEPWHADVFDFLELRKNHGSEEKVTRVPITVVTDVQMLRTYHRERGTCSMPCGFQTCS